MRWDFFLFFNIVLCSCAADIRPISVEPSWTGHQFRELVGRWGYPTKTIQMPNGNSVHLYSRTAGSGLILPGETVNDGVSLSCDVWFEVDDEGTIIRWRYSGHKCRSAS